MQPTIGRVVHYALTADDAKAINKRRADFAAASKGKDGPAPTGYVAHMGNEAVAGQYYPAMIVAMFDGNDSKANLQVWLDGSDTFWATSRPEGSEPGAWRWPTVR